MRPLRVAIIGAGFSGLSVAWHLLAQTDCEVVIFDPKGIGGGASGIATGLLHPYVGEQGRRSMLASEGLLAAQELIETAEKKLNAQVIIQRGIIRYVQNEEQKQMFLSHSQEFGDVRPYGENSFWIESGMTIDCPLYLQGLWQMIAEKGAQLISKEISDLKELADFDHVIIAAGAGATKFPELNSLKMSVLKGQVLMCRAPADTSLLPASAIGKGYVALSQEARTCLVGSTYEREDLTDTPNAELAKSLLFEKIGSFFPAVEDLEVIDCRAALRIVPKGHYFPIASRVNDNLWVLTGMGSRGLLYHALLGKHLAESILDGINS
jgi:glycine/D-amino acid oxidase-like deaminating enzyme